MKKTLVFVTCAAVLITSGLLLSKKQDEYRPPNEVSFDKVTEEKNSSKDSSSEEIPDLKSNESSVKVPLDAAGGSTVEKSKIAAPKKEGNIETMYSILSAKIRHEGFSDEVRRCVEDSFRGNLKLEKLLTPEQIVEKCGQSLELTATDQEAIKKIVRSSISDAQDPIDLRDWRECGLKKPFAGASSCFKNNVIKMIDDFYNESIQEGVIMPYRSYTANWYKKTSVVVQKIADECPEGDRQYLNEVFLNDCK